MKKLILMMMVLSSVSSFAYTEWTDYTPESILSGFSIATALQNKIIIHTKGEISTCHAPFEMNRYRSSVESCSEENLSLKITHKNNADCDAGVTVRKTLKVKISKSCLEKLDPDYSITINGAVFKNH